MNQSYQGHIQVVATVPFTINYDLSDHLPYDYHRQCTGCRWVRDRSGVSASVQFAQHLEDLRITYGKPTYDLPSSPKMALQLQAVTQ